MKLLRATEYRTALQPSSCLLIRLALINHYCVDQAHIRRMERGGIVVVSSAERGRTNVYAKNGDGIHRKQPMHVN
jgi:hypothetical protein